MLSKNNEAHTVGNKIKFRREDGVELWQERETERGLEKEEDTRRICGAKE